MKIGIFIGGLKVKFDLGVVVVLRYWNEWNVIFRVGWLFELIVIDCGLLVWWLSVIEICGVLLKSCSWFVRFLGRLF